MLRTISASLLLAFAVAVSPAAASTNYGDYTGISIIYRDVTEATLTAGDPDPIFGAPTLAGDGLDFNPIGFSSTSSGAGGTDITDGQLTMTVEAKPTKIVDTISFSEAGEFDLAAAFGYEANNAYAEVTATIWINIIEIDGVSVGAINETYFMTFTEGGDWLLSTDGSGVPFQAAGVWSGDIDIDITQLMIDNGAEFVNGATKVEVSLDNHLKTISADGTTAFIAKKDFQGLSITTTIPEPSTAALLGLGLVGLSVSRRRR